MDYSTQQLDALTSRLQQLQQMVQQQKNPFVPAPQPQAPQKMTATIPEVDGIEGARQYLKNLGPSSSAAVFDKSEAVFYGLSVDANGNPAPIKIGRFTLEDAPEPGDNNITKADLEAFEARIMALVAGKMKKEEE
jgi:hypothetical protein